MKKLLLSIILIAPAVFTQAQDAKPTKEQTIEYILNSIKDYKSDREVVLPGEVQAHYIHKILSIDIKDCEIFVSTYYFNTSNLGNNKRETYKEYSLKLNDIEKVEMNSTSIGDLIFYFIKFTAFNNKNSIQVSGKVLKNSINTETIENKEPSISFAIPNDEKLIQAFNHLRKLCGAPEPIKF